MTEPPQTDEGWFVLHDFRTIDWDAWRDAPERVRERALDEGVDYLQRHEAVEDADEGATAVYSILGDKADLLVVHFRPSLDDLSTAERRFEQTAFADFTDQPTSYISVTEVSGYVSDDYFTEGEAEVDQGLVTYIEGKLKPDVPDEGYVCFYPMSKRRGPEHNWYDLPFDERADLMEGHGEKARKWGGKVKQTISSSFGYDDFEWGVTLWADDAIDIKDIVYKLRFDDATSKYGEFGSFYVGRRFPPADLAPYLDGEDVSTPESDRPHGGGRGRGEGHPHEGDHDHGGESPHDEPHGEGGPQGESRGESEGASGDGTDDIRGELEDLDVYAGKPHGEDVYATVLYSEAGVDELFDEVEDLRESFDHYGTHVKTAVYDGRETDRRAVVSVWESQSGAETAAGYLSELPGVVSRAGEESGFGTMGMFYTVKPDHRDDFVAKFDTVTDLLGDMEGHHETDLMVNVEDENDMFIASQWRSQEDAMEFFRSEDFRDTVQWGRDVLADRPRHVFLA